jgi:hypothetical protein
VFININFKTENLQFLRLHTGYLDYKGGGGGLHTAGLCQIDYVVEGRKDLFTTILICFQKVKNCNKRAYVLPFRTVL